MIPKIILGVIGVIVAASVLFLHWHDEKAVKDFIVIKRADNQTHVIDSLRRELKKNCDTLATFKPIVEQAVKKLKYYDSIQKKSVIDTLWIKRMRIDLYEARTEIRRLCTLRFYKP